LLAGAVDVDITPPPGMPKAGYSANAHDGSGFRTRLRARILHLRAGTASLAIVQCDLLGGSAVVQHLVAAAIADRTDIPLAGVFIGATHTHAGPGQYLGTDFYNRFASNRSGFDPAFAQFLVDRISAGIVEAHDGRRPARLAFGTADVWGLTRNRSLDAHVRNPSVEDPDTAPQHKFHAVNPDLHLLRVDTVDRPGPGADDGVGAVGTTPLAAMVVFSVHGTGIPMTAEEYNAASGPTSSASSASTSPRRPVTARHRRSGTHAVWPRDPSGCRRHLGRPREPRWARAAALHVARALAVRRGHPRRRPARVDLGAEPSIDGITCPDARRWGRPRRRAHENVTPVVHRIPPLRPAAPSDGGADTPGAKWVIGSRWLQPVILRLAHFHVLPVHVLRIGGALLVGLPFELTVDTGRRIEEAVIEAAERAPHDGAALNRVIVSSVANEYAGYATTPQEYEQQNYEGAHTLYGPATQPFLAAHAARLARDVLPASVVQDVPDERTFDLKVVHHLPRADPAPAAGPRQVLGPAVYVDPTTMTEGYWQLEWLDVAPAALHWHEPLVAVEAADGPDWSPARRDGRRVDDQGWDLQVIHLGSTPAGHRYAVRWWDPEFRGGRPFRFVLLANNGRPRVESAPFH
jgi:neutral ceramidase